MALEKAHQIADKKNLWKRVSSCMAVEKAQPTKCTTEKPLEKGQ